MENETGQDENLQDKENFSDSTENPNDSNEKHELKIVVVDGEKSYDISSLNSVDSISLDEKQYKQLQDSIKSLKSDGVITITDKQFNDLLSHIDGVNKTVSKSVENEVVMPSDWYTYMGDLQAQQAFFLSLIFGILLALAFFKGLTSHE